MDSIPFVELSDVGYTFDAENLLKMERMHSFALFRQAVDNIKIIRKSFITVCACSFGKDSTVVLLAALSAHLELMSENVLSNSCPFVVTHIDTGVENHLMQMLCLESIENLKSFCKTKGVHLELHIGRPPLAKQWSSLFLSGLKLISSARTNNDCAEILKVDNAARIERMVEEKYKGRAVTLLGSRLSESARRAANMKRRGTDLVTAESLFTDQVEKVFAPIIDMTDENVWDIIRGAGTDPIVPSGFFVESFEANHRLLNLIYKDSADGSCRYSAKQVKGEKNKAGGCGGSARTGCYTCAKSITDKSGEEQAKRPRHAHISGNMLKVRNYIMFVAQDIKYRTYHSRAVDYTTGAIALQPNTLNTETIERLIWLLSQVTADDAIRAEKFTKLVEQGRELEDAGYADIVNCDDLDALDKAVFARVYRKHAQRHLIKPMGLDIALFLSSIHARDGVRLPAFQALAIWMKVCNGARVEYPNVDPNSAIVSDIPDAVMVLPDDNVPYPSITEFDFLTAADGQECEFTSTREATFMPVNDAKIFEPNIPFESCNLQLSGIVALDWFDKISITSKSKKPRMQFSKRTIKRVKRVGGNFKVISRGRTSLNSASFSFRANRPNLYNKLCESIPLYASSPEYVHALNIQPVDDMESGYDINLVGLDNFIQFGGIERALDINARSASGRRDNEKFFYGGIEPFKMLLRYGVLKLSSLALSNTKRILCRTVYFNRLGLFRFDELGIVALSQETGEQSIPYSNTRHSNIFGHFPIRAVFPMADYRKYKASVLAEIRSHRNKHRASIKEKHKNLIRSMENQDCTFALAQLAEMKASAVRIYEKSFVDLLYARSLVEHGVFAFDGTDYRQQIKINKGIIQYIRLTFTNESRLRQLFDRRYSAVIFENASNRYSLFSFCDNVIESFNRIECEILRNEQARLGSNECITKEDVLVRINGIDSLSDCRTVSTVNVFKKSFNMKSEISLVALNF